MEDDDEFGDLYTDVLRPLEVKVQPQRQQTGHVTASGKEPPTQGRPIDPNIDSDDDEILYGASNSMTSDLKSNFNPGSAPGWSSNPLVRQETLPEHKGIDLNFHSNSGAARIDAVGGRGFAARVLEKGHGLELRSKPSEKLGFMEDDDDINIIVEEREDKDEDLVEKDDDLKIKDDKMYANAVQDENTMNFVNGDAVCEPEQMIPGLSGRLENPRAPNIEDDWESEESDDDLQIVLNDNNHGPMGMERMIDEDDQDGEGLVIVADNADVSHHQNQAQRMMDEQEWGGEEGGSGADGEKDSLDITKASGGGGGAAPAAAQPKIAYSNHAFHHPFSSQFKYVRPGAAPLPPGGQVRPPINMGPPAGRGRGDWRPAGMQKAFHPGYGNPAWGGNAAGRGYGSGLDFTLPSHKTIFEVDIDGFEEKPWKLPGIDVSDFFNFGLNEDTWRDYCKQLEQLRLEMTMQSKIRVYESGRTEQDYDPDLPPELAAAAAVGIQDNNQFQNSNHGKVDTASADLARAAARDRTSLPVGRPISVETGYGERMPSIDTRRPRMHDMDAIIEIVCQGSADGDETPEQQDNDHTRKAHDEDDGLQPVDADHVDSSYSPAYNNGNKREFDSNNDGIAREDVSCLPSEVDDREIEERSTKGRSVRSPMMSARENKRGIHITSDQNEESYHSPDGEQSPASSSTHSVRSDREQAVVVGDEMNDALVMEKEEVSSASHEDVKLYSIKKQKTNSQEYSDGKDSKIARSYDRSGSSEHLQSSRDDVDGEVQRRQPLQAGKSRRDEDNTRSKDHFDRNEAARQNMAMKGREDSFSCRGMEAKPSFHQHGKTERDKDYRGGRTRLEDPRKREHGMEVSTINRDKLREKEKDEHHQSRNQLDNGSWRGSSYEYDTLASRQRDRDDHLKSRSERVDDLHSTRRKEESHNHKESSTRRKREREDGSDQLKRDEQSRSKDSELRYARQKEGGSSQRERSERPRERDDLSKRERVEAKPVMRSGRAADEKAWISHSRGNDDYRGSSRDYHPKDIGRHGDQPKQRDRVENESSSQRRSHEDAHARGNQLSNDEKRARYEKSISRNDRGSDTNSRPHDYKRKETTRKGKESDSGDHSSLIPSKRNQNEDGGAISETASFRGRTEQQSGPGHVNQQQSSRKHKEEASTDDEQPDSRRGRSKLERWGSHKEKDFAISSSSLKKRDRDTHKSSSGASVEVPSEKIEGRSQPPAASDNKESCEEMNNNDEYTKAAVEVKHLDTVAKLKKRSERFKLPMPSDKETVAVKKMEAEPLPPGQPETRPDSEIKSERPARKRRWTGN